MSLTQYGYYCETEATAIEDWRQTVPTVCKNDPLHTIRPDSIYIGMTGNYFTANTDIAIGSVSFLNGGVVQGFGLPPKVVFDSKSAAYSTVGKCGSNVLLAWSASMSTPTAGVGYICIVTNGVMSSRVCFSGTSSAVTNAIALVEMNSSTFIIVYRGPSSYLYTVVCTISGGVISCNSPVAIAATTAVDQIGSLVALKVGTQLVIAWRDTASSSKGSWLVGTLSGVTITWNVKTNFTTTSVATNQYALCGITLDSTRFVLFYDKAGTVMELRVGTIAGTGALATITSGTVNATLDTTNVVNCRDMNIVYVATDKFAVFYRRSVDNVSQGMCAMCTVSGTTITTYTPIIYTGVTTGVQCPQPMLINGAITVLYINGNNASSCEATYVTFSGNVMTASNITKTFNISGQYLSAQPLSSGEFIVAHRDVLYYNNGVINYGLFDGSNMSFNEVVGQNLLGFVGSSYTTGDVVPVQMTGPIAVYSGLTPGATYYAHGDGSVSTISVASNNSYVPVKVGIATSSTTIV